jgi:thioredoxin-like negative regulator of GroEL
MAFGANRGKSARAGRAPSLRAPLAPGKHDAPPPAPPSDRPSLRLAVSRGVLGIELDAPFAIGPLQVVDLALGLPNIRFPVDLSGGVARFRHRRGALSRIAVEAGATALASWAAPRLRGLFAESAPEVVLAPFEDGLSVGVRSGRAALAFDVIVAPIEGDLRLIPDRARGLGLTVPPHALAMRALTSVAGPFGRVLRGAVVIAEAAAQLGRHVLPAAGARAPSAAGVRWEAPEIDAGEREGGPIRLVLSARAGASPPALGDRLLRALELAELCGDADQAAFAGDFEKARRLYLAALERAPRHPEISQRAAWIDVIAGDRAEGALSTIVEAMPAAFAGVLGGALLAAVGDEDGARVAYTRAAQVEAHGALAALTWLEAARLAPGLAERLDALDGAIARAPSLDLARWERLEARLDVADVRGARADAEHLEAAARGSDAKHAVWKRAADAFLSRGYVAEAGALFERALRYAPDSIDAVTGLARSLRAAKQDRRAVDLFARAVALAARAGVAAHAAEIELARALAEVAGDRPAAIARVRAIPPGLAESAEARFLEGRWRAEIGDLAGAALAFGRLRDAIELEAKVSPDRAAALAAMLGEAAAIEENERGDVHAAQRDLGLALRLRPKDPGIAARFRRVAAIVAKGAPAAVVAAPAVRAPEPVVELEPEPEPPPATEVPPAPSAEQEEHDEAADEALVQELTDRLRANPRDHAIAMELADALERLGRNLDLLALLSARLEEGDEEERREVAPRRRAVLRALADEARDAGRASEAELYEMMAESGGE